MAEHPLHPIQVAARRSGLSVELIRAWERRYHAIEPTRTRNQHRLYRDEDIERLRLLARATHAGRRIGAIARSSIAELQTMVEGDEQAAVLVPSLGSSRPRTDAVMEYFDRCLEAIDRMDSEQLTETLSDAEKNLAELFMQEDLIAPLIQHMQDECRNGTLRMAQKHMAEGVIRSHLLNYATRPGAGSVFRVVVAGGLAGADELRCCAWRWRPGPTAGGQSTSVPDCPPTRSRTQRNAAEPCAPPSPPTRRRLLASERTAQTPPRHPRRSPDPPARL